jgi:hypothetical protein
MTATLINDPDPAGTAERYLEGAQRQRLKVFPRIPEARAGQIRRRIKVIRLPASKGRASRLFTWVATATGPLVRADATPLPSGAQPLRALV